MKVEALSVVLTIVCLLSSPVLSDYVAYSDGALNQYWQDWSYGGNRNWADTSKVYSGTSSVSMAFTTQYAAFSLYYQLGWYVGYTPTMSFWFNPGSKARNVNVYFDSGAGTSVGNTVSMSNFIANKQNAPANTWTNVVIPINFAGFGINASTTLIYRIDFAPASASDVGTMWFDQIVLLSPPFNSTVGITVNANNVLRLISTDIYGVNFAEPADFAAVGYTVNRKGGDAETRYNWQTDVNNHAQDWYFQNTPNDVADVSALPFGSSSDVFAQQTLAAGAKPAIQLTTIGWIANPQREKQWGFSVAKYGQQQATECTGTGYASWCMADDGNGIWLNGSNVVGNDPHDTSFEENSTFAVGYIDHLRKAVGIGANYFLLDNEAGLWHEEHRDVHPNYLTYDEMWGKIVEYGRAIKDAFPDVKILGPSAWNWCEYWFAPGDASGACAAGQQYAANGPFTVYLLQKLNQYKTQYGIQLIDYYDIHYYPASLTGDPAHDLRSTKSLYDPYYTDESWLGTDVGGSGVSNQMMILPRFRNWISTYAPWLKFSISEHNWGEDGIVSALNSLEVLALFAREGVDMSMRFEVPQNGSLVEAAYKLMMNFDGTKTKYSGVAIEGITTNNEFVPVYAAKNNQKLFVLLINKDSSNAYQCSISLTGTPSSLSGTMYTLNSQGLSTSGSVSVQNGALSHSVPSYTAQLFVFDLPANTPTATFIGYH